MDVKVYSTEMCPWCKKAKDFLTENKVEFEYIDVSKDPEAAEEMEISRPVFSRLIEQARKKIAQLIINGHLLSIEGGNIHFRKNIIKCSK